MKHVTNLSLVPQLRTLHYRLIIGALARHEGLNTSHITSLALGWTAGYRRLCSIYFGRHPTSLETRDGFRWCFLPKETLQRHPFFFFLLRFFSPCPPSSPVQKVSGGFKCLGVKINKNSIIVDTLLIHSRFILHLPLLIVFPWQMVRVPHLYMQHFLFEALQPGPCTNTCVIAYHYLEKRVITVRPEELYS